MEGLLSKGPTPSSLISPAGAHNVKSGYEEGRIEISSYTGREEVALHFWDSMCSYCELDSVYNVQFFNRLGVAGAVFTTAVLLMEDILKEDLILYFLREVGGFQSQSKIVAVVLFQLYLHLDHFFKGLTPISSF